MSIFHLSQHAFVLTTALAAFVPMAAAEWKAANEQVVTAAKDPRIAAVLAAVSKIDDSLLRDDHDAFAALLSPDLVVNNPLNQIFVKGSVAGRNASGLISYSRYERSVEYAGMLGEMVLLMGEERVVPKGKNPAAGKEVRRRFTDVWRFESGHWVLVARQATIIGAP